jgi:hypothetical protein
MSDDLEDPTTSRSGTGVSFDFVEGEALQPVRIIDDAKYFAALRVIARLMAVGKVQSWWPGYAASVPDDEREIMNHARCLVGGYDPKTGASKVTLE